MDLVRVPGVDAYDVVVACYSPGKEALYLTDTGWQPSPLSVPAYRARPATTVPLLPAGIPRITGRDHGNLKAVKIIGEALGLQPS